MNIERAPTPKRMLPKKGLFSSQREPPIPFADGMGIFYFRLFLLSRKASNAMSIHPKEISKPIIPRKTIMVS